MRAKWMTAPPRWQMQIREGKYYYCNTCNGFFVHEMVNAHDQFHQSYTNRTDGNVSTVMWCDMGNHPFKTGAPGSAHFENDGFDSNGNRVVETMDVCQEHNPLRAKPQEIVKELNAQYQVPTMEERIEPYL